MTEIDSLDGTPPKGRTEDYRESLRSVLALDSRDWSLTRADAWLWGVILGWDDALDDIAAQHHWDDADVARIQRLHAAFNADRDYR